GAAVDLAHLRLARGLPLVDDSAGFHVCLLPRDTRALYPSPAGGVAPRTGAGWGCLFARRAPSGRFVLRVSLSCRSFRAGEPAEQAARLGAVGRGRGLRRREAAEPIAPPVFFDLRHPLASAPVERHPLEPRRVALLARLIGNVVRMAR